MKKNAKQSIKKQTAKKALKKPAKKSGEQLKKEALAEIAQRLNGSKKRAAAKAKPAKEKRASGLDLAAKVLAEAKEPLNAKAIAERAITAGWKTNGKTPHATLFAAIIREIAAKGDGSRFRKTDRGLFTINPRVQAAGSK
jgi:hypothetical protein